MKKTTFARLLPILALASPAVAQAPPPPVLVSPDGVAVYGPGTTVTPTYSWNEVAGATQYRVRVLTGTGVAKSDAWYQAVDVCSGGTCSKTPSDGLSAGPHTWRMQSKIGSGTASAWSDPKSFNAAPQTWDGGACMTPKKFATGDFNGDGRTDRLCAWSNVYNVSLAGGDGFAAPMPQLYTDTNWRVMVADVNLDGASDVIAFEGFYGKFWVSRSTGNGFTTPELWGTAYRVDGGVPYDCRIDPVNGGIGDFDGDSLPDVFCKEGDEDKIFIGLQRTNGSGQQFFDFTAFAFQSGTCDANGQRIGVADLNADGKDDWYCISTTTGIFSARLSNGTSFVNGTFTSYGPFCALNKWTFVDINADGRADAFCPNNANVALSTGRSFINQGSSGNATASATDVFGADVDGDGASEIVINRGQMGADDISVRKWVWDGTKMALDMSTWKASFCADHVFSGDINGDGKADLICETNQTMVVAGTGGEQPDQMTSATNGLGGTTEVTYAASTTFPEAHLFKNQSAAFPEASNPGVRYLVKTIRVKDGRGGSSTTEFAYKGGKMDREERQFLGYKWVKATAPCLEETETTACPGEADRPTTETWFSQELASTGAPLIVETKDGAGTLLTSSSSTYDVVNTIPRRASLASTTQSVHQGSSSKQTTTSYTYDSHGNVTQTVFSGDTATSGDELQTDSFYFPNNSAYIVNRLARVERRQPGGSLLSAQEYLYDGAGSYTQPPTLGRLTKVRAWLDPGDRWVSKTITYDSWGNPDGGTDETSRPLPTTIYDDTHHLFPQTVTNGAEESQTTLWDFVCGVPTSTTDANGQTSTFQYDNLCRPTRTDDPMGGYQINTYLNLGNPLLQRTRTESTPATGVSGDDWAETLFDGMGRTYQSRKRGPTGSKTILSDRTFNGRGLVASGSAPYYDGDTAYFTKYEYDSLNRVTRTEHPDNHDVETSYGLWERTVTDENGKPSRVVFDAYGRTIRSERTLSGQPVPTESTYDPLGNLTGLQDAVGNTWSWQYDTLGRNYERNDPDAGIWTYQYDDAGRLTQQTDAKGQIITFDYDSQVGRLFQKVSGVGTTTLSYGEPRSGFYNVGRLTTVTSPGSVLKTDYDKLGRPVKNTRTLDGVDYTFTKHFDASGRSIGLTYPDGDKVGDTTPGGTPILYDQTGRVRVVPGLVTDVDYDAAGRPTLRTNANGTQTTWGFSAQRGFLQSIDTSGPTVVQALEYINTPVGMVEQVTSPITNESWFYTYDDFYRLTIAQNLTAPANSQSWDYDEIGRIVSNSRVGTYTYPLLGQPRPHAPATVNGVVFNYDPNGNLIDNGTLSPTWDQENRITAAGPATFQYDSSGERLKKVAPGTVSLYPMGDDYEITNGTVTKYISIADLGLVAKRVGNTPTTYWLHRERLGSIQAVTDSTGAIVQRRTYRPYGEKIADSTGHVESRGWIDQRQDAETGLTYLHARYYDQRLGLFASPDPLGPAASMAAFSYAHGNPVNATDRTGLAVCYVSTIVGGYMAFPFVSVVCTEVVDVVTPAPDAHVPLGEPAPIDPEASPRNGEGGTTGGAGTNEGAGDQANQDIAADGSKGGTLGDLAASLAGKVKKAAKKVVRKTLCSTSGDYIQFNASVTLPIQGDVISIGGHGTIDRHGQMYVGVGPGLGLSGKASGSLVIGTAAKSHTVVGPGGQFQEHSYSSDAPAMRDFNTGWSLGWLNGLVYGFGGAVASNGRTSSENGIATPQVGGSLHHSWNVGSVGAVCE